MKAKITGYTFYKYSVITFLMLISAINFNMFINTTKTVSGGTNGISIIFEQLFDINPSISILVLSSLILLITLLNKQYDGYSTSYTFGSLESKYGKENISMDDVDVIKVVISGMEIYLKRLYG